MNQNQPKSNPSPVYDFPSQSEEDFRYAIEKNSVESLLIGGGPGEEKIAYSSAPQHGEIENFEIEEEEEGESIKQDKVTEAEKYLKMYPKLLWFTVIGAFVYAFLLFVLVFQLDFSEDCKEREPEIIILTNIERISYWLCNFCSFVMAGFQIAFVFSIAKVVKKRDYAESLFATKMIAGYMAMFLLIVVLLCTGYPLNLSDCRLPDNVEKFMCAELSGVAVFFCHTIGICKVRSALSTLAKYGKIPL